jgi:hypothetical protein
MSDLQNATPFGARLIPSTDRDGRDLLLVVVAAQFELPEPGYADSRLMLFRTQEPPPLADEFIGEPGASSLRREGQSPYTKPATDIVISGDAVAARGRPVTEMDVRIRVGPVGLDIRVSGERTWQRTVTDAVRPSRPAPFVTMPLVWERAFGGVAGSSTERRPIFEPRNPVGCGLEVDPDTAVNKPLPNLEDPRQLLSRLSDRPRPVGVGPVARHWQPRAGYAGTYDEEWRRDRAPLWPADFDERFFCGAPAELQARPHLAGGEAVILEGLHPNGLIAFRLPRLRLVSSSHFTDRVERRTPVLDGVLIETDVKRVTMYYRAVAPVSRSFVQHRETVLRLVAPWEGEVAP